MKTTKKEINGIMFEFVNEKREAREYKTLEQENKLIKLHLMLKETLIKCGNKDVWI